MDHRRYTLLKTVLLGLAAAGWAAQAPAQDRAEVDTTQIIGNRELPKVLYIVPWKKPLPPDPTAKPPSSVIDEMLAPLDREVFRRQIQLGGAATAATSTAVARP